MRFDAGIACSFVPMFAEHDAEIYYELNYTTPNNNIAGSIVYPGSTVNLNKLKVG